jgi:excisionase family DNA binding protein
MQTTNQSSASPWLTSEEAASYLKIEPRTLVQWARSGKVKAHALSGARRITWRFRTIDLDEIMLGPSVALKTKRRIQ